MQMRELQASVPSVPLIVAEARALRPNEQLRLPLAIYDALTATEKAELSDRLAPLGCLFGKHDADESYIIGAPTV